MALGLELNAYISDGGTVMTLTDTTGIYEVTSNPNGWGVGAVPPGGASTPSLKDINYAVLTVTDPAGTITAIDLIGDKSLSFDSDTIPSDITFALTLDDLGYADVFLDGMYKFQYDVSDGGDMETGNTATAIFYRGAFYNIQLQLLQKIQGLHRYYTNHQRSYQAYFNDLTTTWMLFQQLVNAGHCGDVGSFNAILETLTDMLDVNSTMFNY